MSEAVRDTFGRPLASLRLSVTERLVRVFAGLGVHKVRLTGGEPLLRHDLATLVGMIARREGVSDLAMTTNGLLLAQQAAPLRAAGLRRVTVSIDTLRPERMLAFAKSARDAEVRFIEYMDVGGATRWSMDQVVSQREMLETLGRRYGRIEPVAGDPHAPADRFRLPDGTTFGIIASTTAPFCRSCDRSRVTADGTWFLCLYAERGVDLRDLLRRGAGDAELAALIRDTWQGRADRGAEQRLGVADRGALYRIDSLRADPHREMHTRGG